MGRRKHAQATPSSVGDARLLDGIPYLRLSPATIATAGIIRGAFEAVAQDVRVAASLAAARARGPEAATKHYAAAGGLAQRSPEYAFTQK
jgi:hypothetical protein